MLDAASAVLVVGIGVATNQVLNDGRWAWWWLAGDLALAGAAAVVTHRASMARAAGGDTTIEPVAWPTLTGPDGQPRTLGEVTPRDLGVHPNRFGAEGEAFYIPREVDQTLDAALLEGDRRIVLVAGPRLAGTTSTLAQAAQYHLPAHRVIGFIDDPRVRLAEMIDQARAWAGQGRGAVLWLDGLTPERFTELATTVPDHLPSGLWVLATVHSGELDGLRVPEHLVKAVQEHAVRVDLGVLSPAERAELHAQEIYADLWPVLARDADLLMGRLMVAWDQIRTALTCDGEDSTDRVALLRAVTDWYRAQLPRPLIGDILDYLYQAYRRELAGSDATAPVSMLAYGRAQEWASTAALDRPQLIDLQAVADGRRFAPHPLLTAIADDVAEPVHWPVQDALWRYADSFFDGDIRRDIGYTALRSGAYPAALRLLDHTDTTIDPHALDQIARWLHHSGDLGQARRWYRRVIATGHRDQTPHAMNELGLLERELGNVDAARDWFQQAVTTGHPDQRPRGMNELGKLERALGNQEAAREWFQQAAATDHPDQRLRAVSWLGVVECEVGALEAGRPYFERSLATGHPDETPRAMALLGALERMLGNLEAARDWFGQALATGHPEWSIFPVGELGFVEHDLGNLEAAREWFQQTLDTGRPDDMPKGMNGLGVLELSLGNVDAARDWFERALATGHRDQAPYAMVRLGDIDRDQGDLEAARSRFERALATGHRDQAPYAMVRLGDIEQDQGDLEAACGWYDWAVATRQRDQAPCAMVKLGDIEQVRGNAEAACGWYDRAVATGHRDQAPYAMVRLGDIDRDRGELEAARTWYDQAVATGHRKWSSHAMERRRTLRWQSEQQRAEHFGRYGWQAYAGPELMRRRTEPGQGEGRSPDDRQDATEVE
ncbi:tetratricopeptide repeat protein [Spirillospora sp. CA-255316]